ncbi:MAG: type II toxin-antitoxin system VapC family toxin [Gammaproteobacteria bacterium]|nr:type II toxin-antitoxin system VapC family toxin [Gammaproteobacteria bacterium]
MKYLIDTCVMSECIKKSPNCRIENWFNQQQPEILFLSSLTIAEIKSGIYKIRMSQPKRSNELKHWLNKIEIDFSTRILPMTDEVLNQWAEITADAQLQGKKMQVMDSLIAATAYTHKLILVTRNVDDFQAAPIEILNPYELC